MPRKPAKKSKSRNPEGRPPRYGTRKSTVTISLSPLGIEQLDEMAESLDLSRSELVERVARGIYPIIIAPTVYPALDEEDTENLGKHLAS